MSQPTPDEEPKYRVPELVDHDAFLEAIKPLLTLLGVNDRQISYPVVIGPSEQGASLGRITFPLTISEDLEADFPEAIKIDGITPPTPYAEPVWYCSVEIR